MCLNITFYVSDNNDLKTENTLNQLINEFGFEIRISYIYFPDASNTVFTVRIRILTSK